MNEPDPDRRSVSLDLLGEAAGVRHAFCTRQGGVSDGPYGSLNCGYGSADERDVVTANRDLALAELGLENAQLATLWQEHTATAVYVDKPWAPDQSPVADGMVTDQPGIALGILTADCAPVLMADPDNKVVAAAHAGWRGAFDGVLEATLNLMVDKGAAPETIVAAIGPCIAQQSYEVGAEFHERFVGYSSGNAQFFEDGDQPGKYRFDLPGFVAARLAAWGVAKIASSGWDTYADHDLFYSYRRTVHRAEKNYGREVSIIALAP